MTTPTTTAPTRVIDRKHTEITKLPTFSDRGTAIAKRLESVKADPKYLALPAEHQAKIRADIYKKYVPASYAGFHLPVPDEKIWVEATGRSTALIAPKTAPEKLSDSYKDSRTKQFAQDTMIGMGQSYDKIALFGTKVTNKAFSMLHGLDSHFSHGNDSLLGRATKVEENIKQKLNNFEDSQYARIQSDDFWLQTHPRDTVLGKLGSLTGEGIATLPLYEAVGSIGGALKAAGRTTSLTSKLATSPVGKFVAKRFLDATEGFTAGLVTTGGSPQGATEGAIGNATFGAAGKVIKIAAAPLIKKWTANTIAMAGKPFAEDLAQSAFSEMQPLDWWLKHGEEAGIKEYKGAQHVGPNLFIFPKSETEGHFVKDGQSYYYNGVKERQLIFDHLHQDHLQVRADSDVVTHKLHEAEKQAIDSVAMAKYKLPLSMLDEKQKLDVLGQRLHLIGEAAEEAPVHLPELHKAEVEHDIVAARQTRPALNSLMGELEKIGVEFPQAVADNDIKAIAKQTGISNTRGASKKVAKAIAIKGAKIDTVGFASHNVQTNAYLRAPRNRTQVAEAVSDRSKAGLNKFIDTLRAADGSKIHFEDQTHRMLYHLGNKPEKGLADALIYRLQQVKGYEEKSPKQIREEANWLHVHLYDLARSGRLHTEGNVFRSTKLGGPMSWTKWQKPLSSEGDINMVQATRKALKQHPEALKSFNTLVKTLQRTAIKTTTPEEYVAAKKTLQESTTTILGHASSKRGNAFMFGNE